MMENSWKIKFSTCSGCLSSDRSLCPVIQLKYLYERIMNKIHPNKLYLCWECVAILKKVEIFKQRVMNADKILKRLHSKVEITPKSLSKLSIANINFPTVIVGEYIDDKPEIEEKPEIQDTPEIEVKEELDMDNEDIDNIQYETIDYDLEDIDNIKTEMIIPDNTEIKKVRKPIKRKPKKYKLIGINEKEYIHEKVKIGLNELDKWREEERSSCYYSTAKFKCDKCIEVFRRKYTFDKHNRKHHLKSNGEYSCDICGCRFSMKSGAVNHVTNHYIGLQCACGFRCLSSDYMRRHGDEHRRRVHCIGCDAWFSTVRQFYAHYRALHKAFICDHCGKKYPSKELLITHLRREHEPHVCPICGVRFKRATTLRSHHKMQHARGDAAEMERSFCVPCGMQFPNALQYRRHVLSSVRHASERPARVKKEKVQCPECPNVYSRKTYMMNHYRYVHMKQSNYYCAECNQQFLNRTRFVRHNRASHEGYVKEKNKLCNICGRGFAETVTLVNHIRTHTGERPYECPYCESKFTQRQAMKSHVKFVHMKMKRKIDDG